MEQCSYSCLERDWIAYKRYGTCKIHVPITVYKQWQLQLSCYMRQSLGAYAIFPMNIKLGKSELTS